VYPSHISKGGVLSLVPEGGGLGAANLMKKNTWLVVASSSMARIFKVEGIDKLQEIKTLEHPESRLRNLDLVSDKPGRDSQTVGRGIRKHALESKESPKHQEMVLFAKTLADVLENARHQGEFDALYLAAGPSFLGLLRQSLDANTAKFIKGEVDKDVTQIKPHELPLHLPFLCRF